MVHAASRPDVLVVGAGVIGLTTAWVLRDRGMKVEVWSREAPTDSVSAVAGAIWYPFLAEPRERVLGWSASTFARLGELARLPGSGVRMQRVTEVFTTAEPELWWQAAVGRIERLPAARVPPPYRAAITLEVPVCATPVHLPWLVARLEQRGVGFVRREVRSLDEAFERAPRVVNCTGLGARELCQDAAMQAVRGQVLVVERVPGVEAWIDGTGAQPFYVIPRGDDVVLGGTSQAGDERLVSDAQDSASILAGLAARVPALSSVVVRRVRVGLRPYRRTVRLEAEAHRAGRLVHNYGHGGSGYTLAWGCAAEVAQLLEG